MKLKNKVAIITGGSRGIGKAAVEIFCKEGASVIIWDILEEGQELAKNLSKNGYNCSFMKVYTNNADEVENASKSVISIHNKIDILINNAGITRDKTLQKMSVDEWQQVIDVNLTGVFNCTKSVSPYMILNNYGRIICTSSVVGIHGNFGQTNYAASKAGVIAMCRTWAKELGKYNITANAVAPGFIKTDMTDAMPDMAKEQVIAQIPLKRMGLPEDIAKTYLFLASDDAAFISGQVIGVNGGQAS